MTYPVLDVARYIINYCNKKDYPISNLKLQKILYFVQAQFLVAAKQPCFSEPIEAWTFGPVVPEVYHYFKFYGNDDISRQNGNIDYFHKDDRELIDYIIEETRNFSASELVEITHKEDPWKNAYIPYCNNVISLDCIQSFFENRQKKPVR